MELVGIELLVIGLSEMLHGVIECLGCSTWRPGRKVIAVIGADWIELGLNCIVKYHYS